MCGADGDPDSVSATRFANSVDAEAYAKRYLALNPHRGCRLYDSNGTRLSEIRGAATLAQRYTRAHAKRDVWIGAAALAPVPLAFLLDERMGWGLLLGMILATKLVMLGIVKLSDGIAGLMDSKPRSFESPTRHSILVTDDRQIDS
jgi:hypothetical protein